MVEKIKLRPFLFKVRYVYILAYLLFVTLNKFIPFGMFVSDSVGALTYSGLAVFGAGLLAVDFLTKRDMFRTRYNGLLVLFYVVYVLSMLHNIHYGWVDNAKTLVWMLIQTFLLMAADPEQTEESHGKWLGIIFDGYVLLWTVGVIMSLGQYITQYFAQHSGFEGTSGIEGFYGGRLYGVFTDPNYAAVCSVIAALLTLYRLKSKSAGLLLKIGCWTAIILNVFYVILSGSRTAELILLALAVVGPIFIGIAKIFVSNKKWYVKAAQQALLILLCVALTVTGMLVMKTGLSYLPGIYKKVLGDGQKSHISSDLDPSETEEEKEVLEEPISLDRPDLVGGKYYSNSRMQIWSDGLKLFEVSPLVGTSARNHLAFGEDHFGPDMYIVRRGYTIHNGYLSLLVYTGVIGAAIMLLWMLGVAMHICKYLIRNRKNQDKYYVPVMIMVLILFSIAISAFPLMGIFFSNSSVEVLFWLILGSVLYMIRMSEQAQGIKEPLTYRLTESVIKNFTKKRTK